jgi:hypothetical protein
MRILLAGDDGTNEQVNLSDVDLTDLEQIRRILYFDKHQVLEGLITEHVAGQILAEASSCGVTLGDFETVIARRRDRTTGYAFIWIKSDTPLLRAFAAALSKRFNVYIVKFDYASSEFLTSATRYAPTENQELKFEVPLQQQAVKLGGRSISKGDAQFPTVDSKVRDLFRQEQGFWGFLAGAYKQELRERVALPRIMKNFGIQPYFNGGVWDVDMVAEVNGKLWAFEVKHKFPFRKKTLYFGLNEGELRLMDNLTQCGVHCVHVILVKPYWDKNVSSMYLFYQMKARQRALLVASVLTRTDVLNVLRNNVPKAPSKADTTLGGKGTQSYRYLPVEMFHRIGMLNNNVEELGKAIANLTKGEFNNPTTAKDYEAQRLS